MAREPFNGSYYKPNGRQGESGHTLLFDDLVNNHPDQTVIIRFHSYQDKKDISLIGLLLSEDLSFNYASSIEKGGSMSTTLEDFQKGLSSGAVAKGAEVLFKKKFDASTVESLRNKVFGGIKTVASTNVTYLNQFQPEFTLDLFIDPHSLMNTNGFNEGSNFRNTLASIHALVYPYFDKNILASGAVFSSPLMIPNTVKGLKEWLPGNYIYDYYDDKLCAVEIGRWFKVSGGLWCSDMNMSIPTYLNSSGEPITIPKISLKFTYHRAVDRDMVSKWFKYETITRTKILGEEVGEAISGFIESPGKTITETIGKLMKFFDKS